MLQMLLAKTGILRLAVTNVTCFSIQIHLSERVSWRKTDKRFGGWLCFSLVLLIFVDIFNRFQKQSGLN